jgi:hypothetical protein
MAYLQYCSRELVEKVPVVKGDDGSFETIPLRRGRGF